MKKLYKLWVKYCPIPRLLGLNKKEVQAPVKTKSSVAKNTTSSAEFSPAVKKAPVKAKKKAPVKKASNKLSAHKLKRINKTNLIALANDDYGLNVNMKMTKNQIIDSILEFYNKK